MSKLRFPHLQRRNGIYHLRMRVPDRLRKRVGQLEISKSLGTYSSVLARQLEASIVARIQETFVVIEESSTICPKMARQLIQACFSDLKSTLDEDDPFSPTTDRPDLEKLEQESLAQNHINSLKCQLESCDFEPNVVGFAGQYLKHRGLDFEAQPISERIRLLNGFARVLIEEQLHFIHRLNDPLGVYQPMDTLFHPVVGETPFNAPNLGSDNQTNGPTVAHAVKSYLAAKEKTWIAKTHNARVWQLGYVEEFLGSNAQLGAITSKQIREYRDKLPMLRAKHGQGKSQGFFEKLTSNKSAQIKNKTAKLIFEPTKAFFRWAKSEEGLIANNPAEDVKWLHQKTPKGQKFRRPFKAKEIAKLFNSPLFTGCKSKGRRFQAGELIIKDAKYWIPILGYYTGARLGELVQLHINDIKLHGDVPQLDINENFGSGDKKHVKTGAGVRQIPLHPDILKLGFVEFVDKRRKWEHKSKRLFSDVKFGVDGQASTEFSKRFATMMDKVDLTDPTLTFHSFRHGAEDAFRNASQPQYVIDAIMGHSDGKVSSDYGVGPDLVLRMKAISAMKLPVNLPDLLL
ncbi:MAG: DUF6538 domain-containing protein [Sphingorhabdus sp.]